MSFSYLLGLITLFIVIQPSRSSTAIDSETDLVPGAYIVEFEDSYRYDTAFYGTLRQHGVEASERTRLDYTLFNGASFQVGAGTDSELSDIFQKIRSVPSVKEVWPVRYVKLPEQEYTAAQGSPEARALSTSRQVSSTNDNFSTHVMTQVDLLRAEGVTGKGIRVAVIDTGVDYLHPALGGCFGAGCLVGYGYDLVGDNFTGNNPTPDPDPYSSCFAHGTHVAGIIAAQDNPLGFTGAAPGVVLGAYRVFGCANGPTTTDILIAAFNKAHEDGSDIITASIASISGWPEDPWATAVTRIVDAGVPCVVAAGNGGGSGLFYASSAADGKNVTGVAAAENSVIPLVLLEGWYTIGNDTENGTAFGWTAGVPGFPNITMPLWAVTPNNTNDGSYGACSPLANGTPDLSRYIVLVQYTTCSPTTVAANLARKGAQYIMFYYADSATASLSTGTVYSGMVTKQQADDWLGILRSGNEILVTVKEASSSAIIAVSYPNDVNAGLIDLFSSLGPTWEVGIDPQIAAPGGDILSTYPVALGAYAVTSGTSEAAPFIAAVYALLMEARGVKDPRTLLSLIMTTAEQKLYYNYTDILPGLASVALQGAGLVQAYDAAHATTLLSSTGISFNDTANLLVNTSFTITNTGQTAVTYGISHTPAYTLYTFTAGSLYPAGFPNPIATDAYASLEFSSTNIVVAAGASVEVTVTPTPPGGVNEAQLPVYSGYININASTDESFGIPYLGVVGSMYSLSPLYRAYTWLAHSNSPSTAASANQTWTLPYPSSPIPPAASTIDMPTVRSYLSIGTALLRCDIVPVAGTKVPTTEVLGIEIAGSLGNTPLKWSTRGSAAYSFTGMTQEGNILPPGNYAFIIRALRIFGDRQNHNDYDTYQLLPFKIQYST